MEEPEGDVMNYLYGDSTPSPLKSNFLEFLRDALDFSVFVLDSDDRIKKGKAQIRQLGAEAQDEQARLDAFIRTVLGAIHAGEKGATESPTARCAARVTALVNDTHRQTIEELRRKLDEDIARIEAAEAASRAACKKALANLLAPHDPHDATKFAHLGLGAMGRYDGTLACVSTFGLSWKFELVIPDDSPWAAPVRVERFEPHFEIRAPQLTGWITKEVKIRPQRLERQIVTEIVDDGDRLQMKLRQELGIEVGFDVEVEPAAKRVRMSRVGPDGDASVGPFDVDPDNMAAVLGLGEKVRASIAGVARGELSAAAFDDVDFSALREYTDFIRRFVDFMRPIVKDISDHSLTPNELVIRRALANDRREEFFVPKSTLREKYVSLPDPLRSFFAPLELDGPARPKPPAAPPPNETPPVRAEIARSAPPPPPPVPPPPPPSTARQLPDASPSDPIVEFGEEEEEEDVPDSEGDRVTKVAPAPAVVVPPRPVPSAAPPPPPPAPPAAPSVPPKDRPSDRTSEITSDEMLAVAPLSARTAAAFSRADGHRNEALVATLKKIALLMRNGRMDEGYRAYAALFASPQFGDYRPEDQRQAIRLMVLSKTPPSHTEDAAKAYRHAVTRLEKLVEVASDGVDYELLGVAWLFLEDSDKAGDAFRQGLAIERERSPQSDLVGTLMRRLSSI